MPKARHPLPPVIYNIKGNVGAIVSGEFGSVIVQDNNDPLFSNARRVSRSINQSQVRLTTLHYLYLPRLIQLVDEDAGAINALGVTGISHLGALGFELNTLMLAAKDLLPTIRASSNSTDTLFDLAHAKVGMVLPFRGEFRSRNMPDVSKWSDAQWASYHRKGRIDVDPVLYRRVGNVTAYLTIDPKYLTTATAILQVMYPSGGRVTLGGVGIVTVISPPDTVVVTPVVLGLPAWLEQ